MKMEVMQRLSAAKNVLNAVSVPNKDNWRAMFTVATLIEEVEKILAECEVSPINKSKAE